MSDIEKKFDREKYLAAVVKDGVDLKLKNEAAKTAVKCNIDAAAEKLECTTTYLRKLIDLEYNKVYDPEKFETNIVFMEDVVSYFDDTNVDTEEQ